MGRPARGWRKQTGPAGSGPRCGSFLPFLSCFVRLLRFQPPGIGLILLIRSVGSGLPLGSCTAPSRCCTLPVRVGKSQSRCPPVDPDGFLVRCEVHQVSVLPEGGHSPAYLLHGFRRGLTDDLPQRPESGRSGQHIIQLDSPYHVIEPFTPKIF